MEILLNLEKSNWKYCILGHSQGSISIKYSEDNKLIGIFTGDLCLQMELVRTDFPGGSHELLIKSINQKLMFFDNAVIIYPDMDMNLQ